MHSWTLKPGGVMYVATGETVDVRPHFSKFYIKFPFQLIQLAYFARESPLDCICSSRFE